MSSPQEAAEVEVPTAKKAKKKAKKKAAPLSLKARMLDSLSKAMSRSSGLMSNLKDKTISSREERKDARHADDHDS